VDRPRAPPLAIFAALSLAIHAVGFAALRHATTARVRFDPSTQTVAGDTLDVEQAERAAGEDEDQEGTPAPASEPEIASSPQLAAVARGRAAGATVPFAAAPRPTAAPGAQAAPPPALFGAVGVRYAADLATTFTRAFPQAASADPIWAGAPLGSAGVAEVSLWIDESGKLASTSIGGVPTAALRRGVERTLALLGTRPFTARAALSRLRLRAWVTRDGVHDGLHGDVFALSGGSFSGDTGTAFFALPGEGGGAGRRVDVELRLLP
jgi:hypothetical protein